jgi:hypothetical protein
MAQTAAGAKQAQHHGGEYRPVMPHHRRVEQADLPTNVTRPAGARQGVEGLGSRGRRRRTALPATEIARTAPRPGAGGLEEE